MLIITAVSYAMFAIIYGAVFAAWAYIMYKSWDAAHNAYKQYAVLKRIDGMFPKVNDVNSVRRSRAIDR